MQLEFEQAWSDLNLRLQELESGAGLGAALQALEVHHRESGFIADRLHEVERHTFYDPENPDRFLRVQYNPRRALRFAGSGGAQAPSHVPNNGCFLCRENIQWQQQGAQLGYGIQLDDRAYFALMNPFPLLPAHVVIASADHRTQDWNFHDDHGMDADTIIGDLIRLVDRMPGHLGFYNGVDAGASIPGHLHYQFVMRPTESPLFPLEAAARNIPAYDDQPGIVDGYPLDVLVWRGTAKDVVAQASYWISSWAEQNNTRMKTFAANIIATRDERQDVVTLYFVPRDRTRARSRVFSGLIGGLEVLGEIVLCNADEKARLSAGLIDYATLHTALSDVRVPIDSN